MIIKEVKEFEVQIEELFKKQFNLGLKTDLKPTLEDYLLKTDILIKYAKKLKCSPKDIFAKIIDKDLPWFLREEQGFLYLKPKNPFNFSSSSFDISNILATDSIEYYFIANKELNEITLLRVKSLFFILFKLREIFSLNTTLYLTNSDSNFLEIKSPEQLKEVDFSSVYFFTKNNEEVTVDSSKTCQKIVFSVKDACNVAYNFAGKIKADSVFVPKCFLSRFDFLAELPKLKNSFLKNPLRASLYFSKNIINNDLDSFVINSSEQTNVIALAKSTFDLLSNIDFSSLTPLDTIEVSDLEADIKLATLRTILFFESAICSGNACEFIASINNYLVLFQKYYNSPKIRQKIAENQLNYYQLSLITSIFDLLKLCHTKLNIF